MKYRYIYIKENITAWRKKMVRTMWEKEKIRDKNESSNIIQNVHVL